MKEKLKKLLDNEGVKYILVGGTNTLISWVLTYLFTSWLTSWGWAEGTVYWTVSALCFVIGITYSFLLNRKYTFKADEIPLKRTVPRFLLNVCLCYLLSYFLMKSYLDYKFANDWIVSWKPEYVTLFKLLAANVLYVVLNYIGQKFYVFKKPAKTAEPSDGGGDSTAQ